MDATSSITHNKIAITGASGFVGRYLVSELLAADKEVVAVVRNPEKVPELQRNGVELRIADLADTEAMTKAFLGCDAVIANAGQVSFNRDYDALIRQNLEGTKNTLQACRDAGVARVVSMSSASVYQKVFGDHAVDETAPLRTAQDKRHRFSIYSISKAMAEQEAWQLAQEWSLQLTTLRPYVIFGAFDQNSFSYWFDWLLRWPVVTPYPFGLNLPMVYAGDLARAAILATDNRNAIGEAFNIGGDNIDFWQFYDAWIAANGPHPFFRLPLPVPFKRLLDDNKIRRITGWQTRPLHETLRETILAQLHNGHFS
ncbi:MAG: NAD-dependent epimerase/dehydratase family protein [Pseudomonadales bacterium]